MDVLKCIGREGGDPGLGLGTCGLVNNTISSKQLVLSPNHFESAYTVIFKVVVKSDLALLNVNFKREYAYSL